MKKRMGIALFGVILATGLNSAFAYDEAEVQKKTTAVNAILDSVYKNPQQRAKYMVVFKEIFQGCAKTCKNEDSKELSSRILETYDEKYLGGEKKAEEVKQEEVKQEEVKKEEPKVEEKKEETKVEEKKEETKTSSLIDPTKPFELQGVEYQIINFKTFDAIGQNTKFGDYRKFPKNDKFVILEFTFKNVSDEDGLYMGNFTITNGENQYTKDSTASVWVKEQLGYSNNSMTKLNKGVKEQGYVGFDMRSEDIGKGRLILEPSFFGEGIDIDITKIPVVAGE